MIIRITERRKKEKEEEKKTRERDKYIATFIQQGTKQGPQKKLYVTSVHITELSVHSTQSRVQDAVDHAESKNVPLPYQLQGRIRPIFLALFF